MNKRHITPLQLVGTLSYGNVNLQRTKRPMIDRALLDLAYQLPIADSQKMSLAVTQIAFSQSLN